MKILLISTLGSTHTIRWANGLSRRGHVVVVFSTCDPLPGLCPSVKIVVRRRFGKLGYLLLGRSLRHVITTERPDIVHAHFASGYGFLCSTWLKRGSYILSMWGSDIFEFPKGVVRSWILNRNLSHAGLLLSTSDVMRREARRYTDRDIRLTPFGVEMQTFRPRFSRLACDGTFNIGTVRVIDYVYGIDTLIKAFDIFRHNFPDVSTRLLIAGDGPERGKMQQLAVTLGVAELVEFVGWLSHDKVADFLNRLDVFCALSRREGFGVAVVEASACGIPVIATNIGGLPEVVRHEQTGYLVRPDSPRDTAERLQELYQDGPLRHRLGRAGRSFVHSRYSWDSSLEEMERIYAEFRPRT